MVLVIQIVGLLFGLFLIYYSFLNYKRRQFTNVEFGFWTIFWLAFILVALFPYILDPIIKPIGFIRTLDFLIISGFLFLIAAIFYNYTITRKNQKQIESIVREIALTRGKKK